MPLNVMHMCMCDSLLLAMSHYCLQSLKEKRSTWSASSAQLARLALLSADDLGWAWLNSAQPCAMSSEREAMLLSILHTRYKLQEEVALVNSAMGMRAHPKLSQYTTISVPCVFFQLPASLFHPPLTKQVVCCKKEI